MNASPTLGDWRPTPGGGIEVWTGAAWTHGSADAPVWNIEVRPLVAQIPADRLKAMEPSGRLARFYTLCAELYGERLSAAGRASLARDLRKTPRQIRRWETQATRIPVIVLVALGAMVAAKRAGV